MAAAAAVNATAAERRFEALMTGLEERMGRMMAAYEQRMADAYEEAIANLAQAHQQAQATPIIARPNESLEQRALRLKGRVYTGEQVIELLSRIEQRTGNKFTLSPGQLFDLLEGL